MHHCCVIHFGSSFIIVIIINNESFLFLSRANPHRSQDEPYVSAVNWEGKKRRWVSGSVWFDLVWSLIWFGF